MEWFVETALGVALVVALLALVYLARAVHNNTRAVEAMRVTLERECGAGDDE